jgi:hypothetical protein
VWRKKSAAWHESDEGHVYVVGLVFDPDAAFVGYVASWTEAETGKAQVSGFMSDRIVIHERNSLSWRKNIPRVRGLSSCRVSDPS